MHPNIQTQTCRERREGQGTGRWETEGKRKGDREGHREEDDVLHRCMK
jgi:hypothetical protein